MEWRKTSKLSSAFSFVSIEFSKTSIKLNKWRNLPAHKLTKKSQKKNFSGEKNLFILNLLFFFSLWYWERKRIKKKYFLLLIKFLFPVPAKVKGGRTVYNVTWGAPVILECTAEGEPPPEITWWENGIPVSTSDFSK